MVLRIYCFLRKYFIVILVLIFCSSLTNQLLADSVKGFSKQEEKLLKGIDEHPNEPAGYIKIANYYSGEGHIDNAVAYASKAIELDQQDMSNYKALSEILLKGGRADDAVKIMEKSYRINPDDYDTLTYLATIYSVAGLKDKVINTLNEGIGKNTDRKANLRVKLAEFYVRHKQYKDAIEQYKLLISERPDLSHFQEQIDKLSNELPLSNKEVNEKAFKESKEIMPEEYREITLKELKNAYVDFQIILSEPFGIKLNKMTDSVKEDFRNSFVEKIKNIGYGIVDNEDKADVVVTCKIEGALKEIIGEWQAFPAKVSLLLPKSRYVIAQYTIVEPQGFRPEINKIINRMTEEIKKDYESSGPKIRLMVDDMPLDAPESSMNSPRRSFIVENNETGPNGENIYYIKNSKAKIASLIYRSYNTDLDVDFPEETDDFSKIKLMIKTHDFEQENKDIFNRYGYFIGTNKRGERRITETGKFGKVLYPNDLESSIHQVICRLLFENGCSVVDLMPIRSSLNAMVLSDIIARYGSTQNIDAFFICCYQLYSKVQRTVQSANRKQIYNDYGLMLEYKGLLIDSRTMEIIFKYSGQTRANMSTTEKSGFFANTITRQAPLEWFEVEGEKEKGYYIINRNWLEKKLLESLDSKDAPILIDSPNKMIIVSAHPLPSQFNYYFNKYFRRIKDVLINIE